MWRSVFRVVSCWLIVVCSFIASDLKIVRAENPEQAKYDSSKLHSSEIKQDDWNKQKDAYQYVDDEAKPKKKKEELKEEKKSEPFKWNFDIDTQVARTILICIVIGILILVIVLLLRKSNWVFNKKVNDKNLLIARLEENLPESDIDPHLLKSLNDKDYRLAFRLYFLLLIQKLALHNQVIWRKEKTNGEYLIECNSKKYYESFATLTLAFDQVWYGEYQLPKKLFDEYEVLFKSILNEINPPK
ncbi:MAG: hypothetical protein WCI97_02900 [Bacteroidota bacterium]